MQLGRHLIIRIITDKINDWIEYLKRILIVTNIIVDSTTNITTLENPLFTFIIESFISAGKTHIYLIDKELTEEDKENIQPSLTNGIIFLGENIK